MKTLLSARAALCFALLSLTAAAGTETPQAALTVSLPGGADTADGAESAAADTERGAVPDAEPPAQTAQRSRQAAGDKTGAKGAESAAAASQDAEATAADKSLITDEGCYELVKRACLTDNIAASCVLGSVYIREKRPIDALELSRYGCALQDAAACSLLGDYTMAGIGMAANPERARDYYARSCGLGNQEACSKHEKD